MKFRKASAIALAALIMACAPACVPDSSPSPSPTPAFTTEAEAFAAAEATYRAYIDAANARRADTSSSPDPEDFLVGTALEDDIAAQRQFDDAGIHLEGSTAISSLAHRSATGSKQIDEVALVVCFDLAGTRVVDNAGADVTPANRPNSPLDVTLARVGETFLIDSSELNEVDSC